MALPCAWTASATAFPHRSPGYSVLIISLWDDPAHNDENIAWARQTYDLLARHTRDAAYSNYMTTMRT